MRFFFFLALSSYLVGRPVAAEVNLPAPEVVDLVEHYCIDCHGGGVERGDLDLEAILEKPIYDHDGIWEHVLLRLDTRQMPPVDEERPDEEGYQALIAALSGQLDERAVSHPQVARGETLRRLTRTEYRNSIRDLLGLDIDVAAMLPKDDSSHGFDNVTVSNLSPTLLNRYLRAAQKISRLAVGHAPASPEGRVVVYLRIGHKIIMCLAYPQELEEVYYSSITFR